LKQFLTEYKMTKNSKSIHGLPAKSYTDQQFWEIECNTVLADGWLFVGFVHEFLKPGDVIPISIAGKPILLIKIIRMKLPHFTMFVVIDVLN